MSISPRRLGPSSLWLSSAALAGAVTGVGDGLTALLRAQAPVPGSVAFDVLLSCVGLFAAPALLCGMVLFVVAASARDLVDGQALGDELRRRLKDPAADLRLCAALLGTLLGLAVCAALVYLFSRNFAIEMANKRNGALSTALVAALCVPLSAPAFFPGYRAALVLGRLLPRPRTLFALLVGALGALAVMLLSLLSVDWRAISFGPIRSLGMFLVLLGLFRLALGRILGGRLLLLRLLPLPLSAALVLSLLWTLHHVGKEPQGRAILGEQSDGARLLLGAGRRLLDGDRDGYAALLGGGDCNDRDAQVHPGALDLPGDGIDQDCEDGDAPPEPAAPLAPAAPAVAPTAPGAKAEADSQGPRWDGNWLIITIDTLRADRISEKLTPNLWALAQGGVRFTNAYAQAPNTPRSFPSVLTSRFPSQVHFVRQSLNFSPVTGKDPTLFTELSAAGYRTIGLFSHFYMEPRTGLQKGFDEWRNDGATNLQESNSDIAAPRITERVAQRLRKLGSEAQAATERGQRPRPFALWTHLFDPHSTYMYHPEFPVSSKGVMFLPARYDSEVAYTDRHVGQMLQALTEAGLGERTAVLVFSDHGESLGEHNLGGEALYFHGESLYEEILRVPLLIKIPGLSPREIGDRIMLIDLAPTVLQLSGVPLPAAFQGRSLVPGIAGRPLAPLPAYAEMLPCTGWQKDERVLVSGDYKLYARFTSGVFDLFNIAQDPLEQRNLATKEPAQLKLMRQQLAALQRAASTK